MPVMKIVLKKMLGLLFLLVTSAANGINILILLKSVHLLNQSWRFHQKGLTSTSPLAVVYNIELVLSDILPLVGECIAIPRADMKHHIFHILMNNVSPACWSSKMLHENGRRNLPPSE